MEEYVCPNCGLAQSCGDCQKKLPLKLEGERGRLIEELFQAFAPRPSNGDPEEAQEYHQRQHVLLDNAKWRTMKMRDLVELHRRVVLNRK